MRALTRVPVAAKQHTPVGPTRAPSAAASKSWSARRAAIIDSVLDFDYASGRTDTRSADAIVAHVRDRGLRTEWILETHVHADHLSAAPYLQQRLGGKIGQRAVIRIRAGRAPGPKRR